MSIPLKIRERAFEGLLHGQPKKALARELGISTGAIRDWSIFIQYGFFDWVTKPYVNTRRELLHTAVHYWLDHYPIGYSDVARLHGIRPSGLYAAIQKDLAKLPEQLRPKRIRFWDEKPADSLGEFKMALLETAIEGCRDEFKKKELKRQLQLTRKALKSFEFVES